MLNSGDMYGMLLQQPAVFTLSIFHREDTLTSVVHDVLSSSVVCFLAHNITKQPVFYEYNDVCHVNICISASLTLSIPQYTMSKKTVQNCFCQNFGEVENECTSHKLILFAIFVPKIFTVGGKLTKF